MYFITCCVVVCRQDDTTGYLCWLLWTSRRYF